jgi:trehalose-phosphatase
MPMRPQPKRASEGGLLGSESLVISAVTAAIAGCREPLLSGHTLLVCDFDGTLAQRSDDSWAARILPASQRALRSLANSGGITVVFLSGRTVADLAERVRVGGATYLGDHGAERAHASRGFRPASLVVSHVNAPPEAIEMAAMLARRVPDGIGADWLAVESKQGAVAFHFRQAPDVAEARLRVTAAVQEVDPNGLMVRSAGARSLEMRANDAPTKATTMAALLAEREPRAVIALGDGRDDALAWDVMRSEADAGRVVSRAIAVAGYADVTADVSPRANLTLATPDSVARLLSGLARLVRTDD